MFALPAWAVVYLLVGFGIQALALRSPPYPTPPPTWLGCAVAVLMFALLWPVYLWCAVKRAWSAAPYPHANVHGGYQPRPSGKPRGNPPSGGSSVRRPGR